MNERWLSIKKLIKKKYSYYLPYETLLRKLPKNTDKLLIKIFLEPDNIKYNDFLSFVDYDKYDEFWIFHGVSFAKQNKAIIISGPAGIGKSYIMQKIIDSKIAYPIDDGFVLVGKKNNIHYVFESGLYHNLRTIYILSKWLRKLFMYKSPFNPRINQKRFNLAIKKNIILQNIAFCLGSYFSQDKSEEIATINTYEVIKIFLVTHKSDYYPPKFLSNSKICNARLEDILLSFKNTDLTLLNIEQFSPHKVMSNIK